MMPVRAGARPWRLGELLDGLATELPDALVTGLALVNERVEPGSLFLACAGRDTHGLDFAADAKLRGASAIAAEPGGAWGEAAIAALAESLRLPVVAARGLRGRIGEIADRFFDAPSESLEVIGVTGVSGKTSVAHFLAQALAPELASAVVSSLGAGFPPDFSASGLHEWDAVTLQGTLSWLRGRGARTVAVEMPQRFLEQWSSQGLRCRHAVLTGSAGGLPGAPGRVTGASLHEGRLFRVPGLAWAVLDADDVRREEILRRLEPGVRVAAYSLRAGADVPPGADLWLRARSVTARPTGLTLDVETSVGCGELRVGLVGRFNASNLLAVLAVMLSRGLPLDRALRELGNVRGVPGHMETFGGDGGPLVVVDRANRPEELQRVLSSLRDHAADRLICVVGCAGGGERRSRAAMGENAVRLSDAVVVTDNNPRGEDGDAIVADFLSGVSGTTKVRVERQRALAIRTAIATAGPEDLVLIAGKGHETLQDMGELKVRFSDRAQVLQVLQERGGRGA